MRSSAASATLSLDEHMEESRRAQRQADRWLISGSILIGTAALGIFGLPLFLRGVWLLRRAQQNGLSVRPMMVTLLGYLVIQILAGQALACGMGRRLSASRRRCAWCASPDHRVDRAASDRWW